MNDDDDYLGTLADEDDDALVSEGDCWEPDLECEPEEEEGEL